MRWYSNILPEIGSGAPSPNILYLLHLFDAPEFLMHFQVFPFPTWNSDQAIIPRGFESDIFPQHLAESPMLKAGGGKGNVVIVSCESIAAGYCVRKSFPRRCLCFGDRMFMDEYCYNFWMLHSPNMFSVIFC